MKAKALRILKSSKLPKINKSLVIKSFYPISAVLLFVSLYHVTFSRRIIPGVYIGKVSVGTMTYPQAKRVLQDYIESNRQPLVLKYGEQAYQIQPGDFDLHYNIDASITRAFEVGRTGNIIIDTKDKIAGVIKPLRIKAQYEYDDNLLSNRFSQIKGEVNKTPENAKFELKDGVVELVSSVPGRSVDDKDLYDKVVLSFNNIDFSSKDLIVETQQPQITEQELLKFKPQVEKIVSNPLKITYETKTWIVDSNQRLDLIDFKKENGELSIGLNKAKFEAYTESIDQEVNEPPRGRVSQLDGDRVTKFEIIQNGKELNTRKFTEDFKNAFLSASPVVELSMVEITPANSTEKYGILSLLATGRSKYTGSAAARIHNLTLAAERISGALVPPGGVFSFNKTVGEISAATGYNSAYIISNGRTVLGEGGGVCQTSTTLFRAVLNAGLPVVMRYPHAYRVTYYEIESPLGFDASVYQPSLDFQFKNDTPNHILIQAYPIPEESALEFKIYGTPDGRTVEISEPVVTNVSGPPAPLYQDDPTLPKGTIKQVDFAAGGANVSFTRVVKRGDEVLFQDKFSSRYQPWRAVFLKGTKD